MQIESPQIFSMRMLIISWPWALLGSKHLIIFPMSLSVKEMLDRDLSVKLSQLVGSTLVFVINEHWLAKKELKSSAFSLKVVSQEYSYRNRAFPHLICYIQMVQNPSVYDILLSTINHPILRNIWFCRFSFTIYHILSIIIH